MRVLSLFDGLGGGILALKNLGIIPKVYYRSEIDPYANAVFYYNNKDINYIDLGDVRNINTKDLKNIDLLIGGSPCQNFSFSGKRNGMVTKENIEITSLEQYLNLKEQKFEFEGQSYLFWEFVRILNEVKPKIFMLENVKMSKKWQKVIDDTFGFEPIEINSSLVSAQNRKRLYWVGIFREGKYHKVNIPQPNDKGIVLKDILEDISFKPLIPTLLKVWGGQLRLNKCNWILNTKSYTITTKPSHTHSYLLNETKTKYRLFSVIEYERLQTLPDNYTKFGLFGNIIKEISKTYRYKMVGNGWTIKVIEHIFKEILKNL